MNCKIMKIKCYNANKEMFDARKIKMWHEDENQIYANL